MSTVPMIAVDAMGGDYAPDEIVLGAIEALETAEHELALTLVGGEDRIRSILEANGGDRPGISVTNATEIVEMSEHVTTARRKKDSSLAVALDLQKRGEADAMVSAGNTGAAMGLSLLSYGRIPGVHRPAIATTIPSARGMTTLLDAGANSECKAENLLQFGIMGSLYHEHAFGVDRPTVGLLSIGEEASKGHAVTQEAHAMLAESDLNFVGNVEGRDILPGTADVVVCDGFTGNVLLKFAESMSRFFGGALREEINASLLTKIGGLLIRPAFGRVRRRLDWQEFGGAPLLGIDGTTIICHGRSEARAIRSAIRVATRAVEHKLNAHIKERLGKVTADDAS